MNLQQAKDQVAISKGYPDWETMENWYIEHNYICDAVCLTRSAMDEVTTLYASEKVKEALKLSAERAYIEYVPSRIPYGGEDAIVDKDSILDLETELIELINKEK